MHQEAASICDRRCAIAFSRVWLSRLWLVQSIYCRLSKLKSQNPSATSHLKPANSTGCCKAPAGWRIFLPVLSRRPVRPCALSASRFHRFLRISVCRTGEAPCSATGFCADFLTIPWSWKIASFCCKAAGSALFFFCNMVWGVTSQECDFGLFVIDAGAPRLTRSHPHRCRSTRS